MSPFCFPLAPCAGREVPPSQLFSLRWGLGGTLLSDWKREKRMEMLSPRSLFSPWSPGPRLGPLCRSAASGHSVRARALLAPPPFLAARTPLPASFRPGFLSRDPRLEAPRRASRVGLAPGVPREGAGRPGSLLACHAAGGGGSGSGPRARLTAWGGGPPVGMRTRPEAFPA